jgi:hypothetical protein
MRESSLCSRITFTAENLVAVDRETIEKILRLGRRLFEETRQRGFDLRQLPWMRFKVRVNTDEV